MRKTLVVVTLLISLCTVWGVAYGPRKDGPTQVSAPQERKAETANVHNGANFRFDLAPQVDGTRKPAVDGPSEPIVESRTSELGIPKILQAAAHQTAQAHVRSHNAIRSATSRHSDSRGTVVGVFLITAYTNSPSDTGKRPGDKGYGITASGAPTEIHKTVAADWSVLPEGTVFKIQGLPYQFTVEDTGGAVHGKHIDMFMKSEHAAIIWGVKHRTVTVLDWGKR